MKLFVVVFALIGFSSKLSSSTERFELWKGGQWEGDIMLTPEQAKIINGTARTLNTGAIDPWYRWPKVGGYVWVPYMYDNISDYSNADRAFIAKEMRKIEVKTCVRFLPRTAQVDYIRITNRAGCLSFVGRIRGPQNVTLQNPGCLYQGAPAHEFTHALGFLHMHQHIDRDQFVTIRPENIPDNYKSAFAVSDPKDWGNFSTSYDLLSLMHYTRNAFGINGSDTIVPKNISYIDIIGRNLTFSIGDAARVNNMYECAGF